MSKYIAISIVLVAAICGCTFTDFFKDSQATAVTVTEKAPVVADAAVTGIETLDNVAGIVESVTGKKLDDATADKILEKLNAAKAANEKLAAGVGTVKAVTGENSYVSATEAVSGALNVVLLALIAFAKKRKTSNVISETISESSETK
jgi:hypothetical protein